MVINGHVRPRQIQVEHAGKKQIRYQMVYQEPGAAPVVLCGVQIPDTQLTEAERKRGVKPKPPPKACTPGMHVSAIQARRCATAVEWHRRLQLHGNAALESLQAETAVKEAAEAARREREGRR